MTLVLAGCPGYLTPRDNLPAVPYHQLPATVSELHKEADHVYRHSRATKALVRARSALSKADQMRGDQYETLWRLARMDGILARWDKDNAEGWAREGRKAATRAIKINRKGVAGHLHHAICSGLLGREQISQARELTAEVVASAQTAVRLDPNYQGGFPRQVLGAIYIYAPAWPAGVGDLDEAVEVLETLLAEHPDVPLNVFYMAEAYRKVDRRKDAVRLFEQVLRFKPRGVWRLEGPHHRKQAKAHLRNLRR